MRVPALMVKSSTISAVHPSTVPISSTTSADSVWSTRRLSAIAVGLCSRLAHSLAFFAYPASGATTTRSVRFFCATASHNTGSEDRSSTGLVKKPCTCGACRSSVTTRSAPAA
jgi:hypothetical protein